MWTYHGFCFQDMEEVEVSDEEVEAKRLASENKEGHTWFATRTYTLLCVKG